MPTTSTHMQASGIVYLAKTPPLASTASDGTFALTLLAYDRIGSHLVEPWRITYSGASAQAFWQQHQHSLRPGQPLRVQLARIRSFADRRYAPEIYAAVQHMELAPLAQHSAAPV